MQGLSFKTSSGLAMGRPAREHQRVARRAPGISGTFASDLRDSSERSYPRREWLESAAQEITSAYPRQASAHREGALETWQPLRATIAGDDSTPVTA